MKTKRMRTKRKGVIHPSHRMGKWESTIVTITSTPRFGMLRECPCGLEQAITATGIHFNMHPKNKCQR